jgi:hypothetical protein
MAVNDRLLAPGGMPNPFGPARDAVAESADMLQAGVDDSKKYHNWNIEYKDGEATVTHEMDEETNKQYMAEHQQLEAIKTSYMEEAARLEQREATARAHPIAGILANVASAMAENRRNPGWVQSLGRFAAAENPTPDALARQRMGVQQGIAGLLREEAGLTGAMATVGARREAARERELVHQETKDYHGILASEAQERIKNTEMTRGQQMVRTQSIPADLGQAMKLFPHLSREDVQSLQSSQAQNKAWLAEKNDAALELAKQKTRFAASIKAVQGDKPMKPEDGIKLIASLTRTLSAMKQAREFKKMSIDSNPFMSADDKLKATQELETDTNEISSMEDQLRQAQDVVKQRTSGARTPAAGGAAAPLWRP